LHAKPLGRPKKGEPYQVTAGERNPIEGKFGQAKTAYGHNRIKARLQQTSESWIATIVLVLNLVKLAKEAPPCLFLRKLFLRKLSSSVKYLLSESIKLKTTEVHLLFLKLSNQQYLILKRSTF
jgi:hypothetical protein